MIGVLGPKGTFTSEAARKLYPNEDLEYLDDVEEVFKYVQSGKGDGVVAVENSLEGSVPKTLECLMEYDVYIVKEATLKIELSLMSKEGAGIENILSHPHALGQCKRYIKNKYPKAKLEAADSTAAAMKQVSDISNSAAIGPKHAASEYGLKVLAESIQDDISETRFIAISKNQVEGGKTSIIYSLKDEPGALYSVIKVFSDSNINLTKIESRPSRKKLGEYLFYVDFENKGLKKQEVDELLAKIKTRTMLLKNLGSY